MASKFLKAQSDAAMAATRLHRDVGTRYDEPVDVLQIARKLGLVLMMQPLENLLGFYVRQSEAAGIVISSRVPESLQRFTLAHEIGHHVLGHEGSADDSHMLDQFDPNSILEVQAQAFAASLLMPLPLMNRIVRDLPATRNGTGIRQTDAYLLSRQLGVSFAAGTWALYRRNLLTLPEARSFVKSGALAAKFELTGAAPITNARADVWVLTEENDKLTVLCRVGDEIRVHLSEDTSTGHTWRIRSPDGHDFYHSATAHNQLSWDGSGVELSLTPEPDVVGDAASGAMEVVQDEHRSVLEAHDGGDLLQLADIAAMSFPDAAGLREVTFVPRQAGTSHIHLELRHAWEGTSDPTRTYNLDLRVRPRQLAGAGLFAPSLDAYVDEHSVTA